MAIPDLTEHGLLPVGVHEATLDEVVARFGSGTPRRAELGESLRRFAALLEDIGLFTDLFVDGSFTTDAEPPGDVDVVMQLPTAKMLELARHPRSTELERRAVKLRFEVDALLEASESGSAFMVGLFTTLKAKDVIARKVSASQRRGIMRIKL